MRFLIGSILVALLFNFATPQSLVLVGGGLSDGNAVIWDRVVELAGGRGVARIGVFTTASDDPLGSADYYIDMFVRVYGAASATYIPVTEKSNNGNDPAIVDLVKQQTGFFFGGGDQARVLKGLRPNGVDTLVLNTVKESLKAGAVVGGTSAGTSCLGESVMITGGVSWNALAYGSYSGGPKPLYPDDLSYDEYGGLGLLPLWLPDTHFSQRGREGRLIRLLQDTRNRNIGTTRGFGVDEDMALVVTDLYSRPTGKVIGTNGGIFFADVTNAVVYPSPSTHFEQVSTHYLTMDDSIDLIDGNITFASWKIPLKNNEYYIRADINEDILSTKKDNQWAAAADQFFDNRLDDTITHLSSETGPRFQVTFDRTSAQGYGGNLPTETGRFVVSYKNNLIGIREKVV